MQHSPSVRTLLPAPTVLAVSLTVFVAFALVTHLWMLNSRTWSAHETSHTNVVTIEGSAPSPLTAACPTGMDTCQVPMPAHPLLLLVVLALAGGVVAVATADRGERPRTAILPSERDPPPRNHVPASVVLLI